MATDQEKIHEETERNQQNCEISGISLTKLCS